MCNGGHRSLYGIISVHVWPPARTRLQRRMLAQFVRIEWLPGDTAETFNRRRMRTIATYAREQGSWGRDHARRVLAWADHLRRPRNSSGQAAALFTWHDAKWLQERRLDPEVGAGLMRPGTRSAPGPVVKRWDEAHCGAQEHLCSHV